MGALITRLLTFLGFLPAAQGAGDINSMGVRESRVQSSPPVRKSKANAKYRKPSAYPAKAALENSNLYQSDSYSSVPHSSDSYSSNPHPSYLDLLDLNPPDPYPSNPDSLDPPPTNLHPTNHVTWDPQLSESYPLDPYPSDSYPSDPYPSDSYTSNPERSDSIPSDPSLTDPHPSNPHDTKPEPPNPHPNMTRRSSFDHHESLHFNPTHRMC